jgi:hypothetical protein
MHLAKSIHTTEDILWQIREINAFFSFFTFLLFFFLLFLDLLLSKTSARKRKRE